MQNLHAGADKMKILKSVVRTVTGFMENMNKNMCQPTLHRLLILSYFPLSHLCSFS